MEPERFFPRHVFAALLAGILSLSLAGPDSAERPAAPAGLAAALRDDEGLFLISMGGREIGKEKFKIHSSGGKVEAQAEIELHVEQAGKGLDFKTFPRLVLDAELNPMSYTWNQKGQQSSSLEVDFRASPAKSRYRTVSGDEDLREFGLDKDVVVVDDNVIHHYELVLARFRMSKAKKQTFRAFIPQEALPGTLTVEDTGDDTISTPGGQKVLDHLVVTTEMTQIDLWADDHQHLQRLAIPAAQFEAVRKAE